MPSFLRRLLGDEKVALDPAFGDRDARRLRRELERGDWSGSSRRLEATTGGDERQFLVQALADWPGRPEWLDNWTNERPDDASGWLVRGAHSTVWAWEARGRGRSETVDEQMSRQFTERLQCAWDELERTRELDSADPTPLAYQVTVARGLGGDATNTSRALLREATSRCPHHYRAHVEHLTNVCEKWHGSHAEMFDFARQAAAAAPEGHVVHSLVPQAHIERWLYREAFEEDPDADAYWRDSGVQHEILDAYEASLGSPHHEPGPLTTIASNWFLCALSFMSACPLMGIEARRIGAHPSLHPWQYLGDPVAVYREIRKLVA